jgi:hypothetical protein
MQQQQLGELAADLADLSSSAQASAGACQRFTSHLQLHLSTVTVLLAAAWAVLLHAAQCACAAISSGFANQAAAARAHLVLLKRSSPSRFYRTAPKALGQPTACPQQHSSAPAPASTNLARRHPSTRQQEAAVFCDTTEQHHAVVPQSTATHRCVRVGAHAALLSRGCVCCPFPLCRNSHQPPPAAVHLCLLTCMQALKQQQ